MDAKARVLVREVLGPLTFVDARKLAYSREFVDLGDDLLWPDHVGELGNDERFASSGELDGFGLGPNADRASTRLIGVAQAVVDNDSTGREVGAGKDLHKVVHSRLRAPLLHDDLDGLGHLAKVVGRHVRGHAHGNAGGAVDKQVRDERRKDRRFVAQAVESGGEVDGFLVDLGDHVHGGGGELALGVAVGGRWVVEGAEVSLRGDERLAAAEVLAHADEGFVDRAVAVRVVFTHRVTDDAGTLAEVAVGADALLEHRVQDAPLHRLKAVANVGDGAGGDDRERVGEEALAHLVGYGNIDDFRGEVVTK